MLRLIKVRSLAIIMEHASCLPEQSALSIAAFAGCATSILHKEMRLFSGKLPKKRTRCPSAMYLV